MRMQGMMGVLGVLLASYLSRIAKDDGRRSDVTVHKQAHQQDLLDHLLHRCIQARGLGQRVQRSEPLRECLPSPLSAIEATP